MLPVGFPYEKDELLFSWLVRLCRANGLDDIELFFAGYDCSLKCDHKKNFSKILTNLNVNVDPLDVLLDTTFASIMCLSMDKVQKSYYLNNGLYPLKKKSKIQFYKQGSILRNVKVCRLCVNEDIKRLGHCYIHRAHNIPGVNICYKHQIPLSVYTGFRDGGQISKECFKDIPLKSSQEVELKYSLFAKDILEANLTIGIEEIRAFFKWNKERKECINNISDEFNRILAKPIKDYRMAVMTNKPGTDRVIMTLMLLFHSVDKIPTAHLEITDEFIHMLQDEHYTFIKSHPMDIIEVAHEICGNHFYTTETGFLNGWRCPYCDQFITDESILSRVVEKTSEGKYRYCQDTELSSLMTIQNKHTGKKDIVDMNEFLTKYPNVDSGKKRIKLSNLNISDEQCEDRIQMLYSRFDKNRLIPVWEVTKVFGNTRQTYELINILIQSGLLFRVARGVLSLTDKKWTNYEIFSVKYLRGQIDIYGYITKSSFTQLLINPDAKPQDLYYASARVNNYNKHSLYDFCNSIHLYPAKAPVSEKSIAILPILDCLFSRLNFTEEVFDAYKKYLAKKKLLYEDAEKYLPYYGSMTKAVEKRINTVFKE